MRILNRVIGWILVVAALALFTTCTRYVLTRATNTSSPAKAK